MTTNGQRPLETVPNTHDARTDALLRLIQIIERLRAPDGCPWDREQTLLSLTPTLIEEAHECVEAIESGDRRACVEEIGDVLLVITMMCQVAHQEGSFDLESVALEVGDKLIRRHPHVFGDARADDASAAIANWEAIKKQERAARKGDDASSLAGVPPNMGAIQRAQRLGAKAVATGFRWPDARGAIAKLREELDELEQALEQAGTTASGAAPAEGPARDRVQEELGDVLLATAQLANYTQIDAESAARAAARRFEARFRAMEVDLGGNLRGFSLDQLMAAWGRAKAATAS